MSEEGGNAKSAPKLARAVEVHLSQPQKAPESSIRPWLDPMSKWLPWAVLLIFGLVYKAEISMLLHHAGKFEAFGFKWERATFESRVVAAETAQGRPAISAGNPLLTNLFRRMNLAAPGLRGMRVLWVDDHPENNFNLRRNLTDYGVHVTVVMTTAEACDRSRRSDFDLVVTDFGRDDPQEKTGAAFSFWLTYMDYGAPIVFYTSRTQVVPNAVPAALVTSHPVELLQLIADVGLDRMAGIAPRLTRAGGPTSLAKGDEETARAACSKE